MAEESLNTDIEEDFDVGDAFQALDSEAPRQPGDTPPPQGPGPTDRPRRASYYRKSPERMAGAVGRRRRRR